MGNRTVTWSMTSRNQLHAPDGGCGLWSLPFYSYNKVSINQNHVSSYAVCRRFFRTDSLLIKFWVKRCCIIRPPGTVIPDGLMFYPNLPVMYLLSFFRHAFSELPPPIALKLCHMVGIWPHFIIPHQKFGGRSSKKNWGPKTCKISVNFGPLQTLIANISGTAQGIQNWKANVSRSIPPAFNEKDPVNFGPLITEIYMWVWTH